MLQTNLEVSTLFVSSKPTSFNDLTVTIKVFLTSCTKRIFFFCGRNNRYTATVVIIKVTFFAHVSGFTRSYFRGNWTVYFLRYPSPKPGHPSLNLYPFSFPGPFFSPKYGASISLLAVFTLLRNYTKPCHENHSL